MSLMKTIEKLCNVFREADTSSVDGRIACWQIIIASHANNSDFDFDAARSYLAQETLLALAQLKEICAKGTELDPRETLQ